MAPTAYSGALQPKKKSELQEIALALRISDQGTKDELQSRIKKHLDHNQDALEEDPAFAGLYGRRKRSVQPPAVPHSRFAPTETTEKPKSSRRTLDPITEATPAKDLSDVSSYLKGTFAQSTPLKPNHEFDPTTPSSLPPLPPSPSPVKNLIARLPNPATVKAAVRHLKQQEVLQNGNDLLIALRAFLSNSRNIWSVTSVCEFFYIIFVIVPWNFQQIPISPRATAGNTLSVPYPPLSTFTSSAFWQVLLHWVIPTFFLPTIVGVLVSFSPDPSRSNLDPSSLSPTSPPPIAPLDPLTAQIIRVAAQAAYPYAAIGNRINVSGLDILGSNWRVLSASVTLAFAFAEVIASAPKVVAKSIIYEQRQLSRPSIDQREWQPNRRAIMPEPGVSDVEND